MLTLIYESLRYLIPCNTLCEGINKVYCLKIFNLLFETAQSRFSTARLTVPHHLFSPLLYWNKIMCDFLFCFFFVYTHGPLSVIQIMCHMIQLCLSFVSATFMMQNNCNFNTRLNEISTNLQY